MTSPDIVVGAYRDDDGDDDQGAVYVLDLEGPPTDAPVTARYLRVQLNGEENYLSLAEVQVFEAVESAPCFGTVFAVYACAAQARSNTSAALEYEVTNDGNTAMDEFVMVAMLPHVGDVGLTEPAPMSSEWRGTLESGASLIQAPAGGSVTIERHEAFFNLAMVKGRRSRLAVAS